MQRGIQEGLLTIFKKHGILSKKHYVREERMHVNYSTDFSIPICSHYEVLFEIAERLYDLYPKDVEGIVSVGTGALYALQLRERLIWRSLKSSFYFFTAQRNKEGELHFKPEQTQLISGLKFVLVDDVLFTGRTLKELETLVLRCGGTVTDRLVILNGATSRLPHVKSLIPMDFKNWTDVDCPICQPRRRIQKFAVEEPNQNERLTALHN